MRASPHRHLAPVLAASVLPLLLAALASVVWPNGGGLLRWIFTNLFYPLIVMATFVITLTVILLIVLNAKEIHGTVRRAIGALLPIVSLVFFVVISEDSLGVLENFLIRIDPTLRILFGALSGSVLMELGKWLLATESDGAASLYAMFLSTIVAFLLWASMKDVLPVLNTWLLGFLLGGGLHVIFRGLPRIRGAERPGEDLAGGGDEPRRAGRGLWGRRDR